jgi:NAD(P)-dependent dehydrogenase (short-subunit alcohol dehydrogenase family)
MNNRFQGGAVLITGGATGLGAAVADLVCAQGGRVAILDVNEQAGRAVAERTRGAFWSCDVSDPDQWETVVPSVEEKLGPIRHAHLNAGVMTQGPDWVMGPARVEEVSAARYKTVLAINIDGVFFGLKTLLPRMVARGGGCVTVTSSAAGLTPIPFDPVYALTKHAVIGLVRSLALAYADTPVRINALCPGGFDSPLLPAQVQRNDVQSCQEVGDEAVDLLLNGATGETRLKLLRGLPAMAVPPPDISLGAR